ncbi:MarR family winged helix-turn-helix transcriptional regulator [Paraburkholderia sp. DHOC27]|uniref:MarR family winged helix-turn-helix transcriptional regulator n=1 Tax=Paraburkholderia sp. DHOC27 TaxID=2303330 RepID=UPI000E3CC08F|nr:MarR family transcriptional regulator [Paraburkholderia sp. DHOC27]RFU46941.1 MarR family transcriptional regulator [Paraburkholderia sp. DHOC27]
MMNPRSIGFSEHQELAIRLQQAGDVIRNHLDSVLSGHRVTFFQFSMLVMLASTTAWSPARIARHMKVDPALVTRALNKLEAEEWVQRTRSLEDRRGVIVSLTHRGDARLAQLCKAASEVLQARFGFLQDEDVVRLIAALTLMVS